MSRNTPAQIYKQANAPDQSLSITPDNPIPWKYDLWLDITSGAVKQCTSTDPYVWVQIAGGGPSLSDAFVTWQSSPDLSNQKVIGPFLASVLQASLPFARGGTILSPSVPINIIVWQAPFDCTVTNVLGYISGATGTTVNARKNGSLTLLSSDITLSAADTWTDGGAVQNAAFVAGDKLEIMFTAIGGAPTEAAVQVDFSRP